MCVRACVRACVYVFTCAGVVYEEYNILTIIVDYIFVDLVNRGVQTLVHEIRLYRNGRCYYYIAAQMPQSPG